MSISTPKLNKPQILLYYGIQESECDANVYHAFRAVDPAATTDDDAIAKDLAEQLDTEPGNDDFQMRSMYIDLPPSLIERIEKAAIKRYLETQKSTTLFDRKEKDHARVFYHITPMSNIQPIFDCGLVPQFGCRAADANERCAAVWLLTDLEALENCLINWAGEHFDEEEKLAIVRVELPEGFPLHDQPLMPCEKLSEIGIPSEYLSFFTEEGEQVYPVARLDYLYHSRGAGTKVGSSAVYYSEQCFLEDLKRELDSGVPLAVVLYRDKQGKTISRDFLMDLDTMPLSLTVEDLSKS